jgi:hypothetical protein
LKLKLPKFDGRKLITKDGYLDESEQDADIQYDIIMGTDLMKELSPTFNFLDKSMTWESTTAPMVNLNQSMTRFMLNNISQMLQQAKTMLNAENHQKRILDANYTSLNIEKFTNGQDHLSNLENEILIELLQANLTTFEGGMRTIEMDLAALELNNNNDGIPHVHYDTTTK